MDSESGVEALTGLAELLGNDGACITFKFDCKKEKYEQLILKSRALSFDSFRSV